MRNTFDRVHVVELRGGAGGLMLDMMLGAGHGSRASGGRVRARRAGELIVVGKKRYAAVATRLFDPDAKVNVNEGLPGWRRRRGRPVEV